MGRRLQFDKKDALVMAMENFWALGYEATSMRTIADNIGIHLGSLYNALGDKDAVFEMALKLNLETHVLPMLETLAQSHDPMGAIDAFLDKVANECAGVENSPGCFLVNSLLEITSISAGVTSTLHSYLELVEDGFRLCLERAVMAGQLPERIDTRAKARFIVSSLFAMRVMGKFKVAPDYITDMKNTIMSGIRCA